MMVVVIVYIYAVDILLNGLIVLVCLGLWIWFMKFYLLVFHLLCCLIVLHLFLVQFGSEMLDLLVYFLHLFKLNGTNSR